jgi:hypothetical protein
MFCLHQDTLRFHEIVIDYPMLQLTFVGLWQVKVLGVQSSRAILLGSHPVGTLIERRTAGCVGKQAKISWTHETYATKKWI